MPIDPEDVTAVIVTRGNVDLAPVLDSLIFSSVVVWDNSTKQVDEMTYGRVVAATSEAVHDVIYSQDDDIVHSPENQRRIVAEYQPGVLTGCMWPEWSEGARQQGIPGGYEDLVFMGSGSVFRWDVAQAAAARYLAEFPFDDFFRLWSDTLVGVIAPTRQLDIRFDALPEAEADYRMTNLPDSASWKCEAIRRARLVRDGERVMA